MKKTLGKNEFRNFNQKQILNFQLNKLLVLKDMKVKHFQKNEYVSKIDPDYKFDKDTTLGILVFFFNKRVLIKVIMEQENLHILNKLQQD